MLKGIRGAISVERDTPDAIKEATVELLAAIFQENKLSREKITAVFFTQTADLVTAYPAKFAREFGLKDVPLMSAQEPNVVNSLPRVIRVLILAQVNEGDGIKHVYLKEALKLRRDLA
ncbi:chorismate mutase [Carboxydothermus pertinax]|uniref:chorismate mutase n=1 Tax=Carboxydothermus pertinax TaxID=870242 RepID=A0A1L8CTQ3_9THEO|nr:chorismate mutase [Carboxydothermus pertinax]GAV22310.1 chorismate mutase [Carboxydothermus pertinax]